MGQIPDRTYTAPDGSLYRVEVDGSVTKIRDGRVQYNDPPSKYKITPDGKIYRVEGDGSVSYLGNAEERTPSQSHPSQSIQAPKKKTDAWAWIIFFIIIAAVVIVIAYSTININNQKAAPPEDYVQEERSEYEEINSIDDNASEIPADENEQYAFICDGGYHGKIGGQEIEGHLTLDTENPHGSIDFLNSGESYSLYGSSNCRDWDVFNTDGQVGVICFEYWNLAYENFARGTYIRKCDNARLPITIYKYLNKSD